ncbi:MAG: alpha/beta hydrolase fold domain-containing protein [Alphaproteobacteria bacterium]|nr:alpha/beta hydrolase fold domain-containing protein [Alphaproteobacteria bacterium]|tara:strand:- start:1620 stop:2546 length:927 start_codon:yes stop_codon:yes gene_type:complete
MKTWLKMTVFSVMLAGLGACQVQAQASPPAEDASQRALPDLPVPEDAPDADAISLMPGAEDHEIWEHFLNQLTVRNVTSPQIYPIYPPAENNNGKAVIVVPGGGYMFASIENEGFPVAERLAEEGYTAFVLKYRTQPTSVAPDAFLQEMAEVFSGLGSRELDGYEPAIDDLRLAMEYVSAHCPELGCESGSVGLIGFSAGAMSVMQVLRAPPEGVAVDSAALIYPPMTQPVDGEINPPLFLAIASDDPLFQQGRFTLPKAWFETNGAMEFHLYSDGGHGFGTLRKGTSSSSWLEQYVNWLTLGAGSGK